VPPQSLGRCRVMPSRTFSDQWEAARLHLHRVRIWLGTPERTHSLLLLLWPLVALVIAVMVLRSVSTAKELADLISAFASLTWPLVALAIVSWFKPEIRAILSRIKKGKLLGMEFGLDELRAKTEAAEATSSTIVSATGSASGIGSATAEGARVEGAGSISAEAVLNEIEEVLREAARSPRLGLMLLSAKIERAARDLAADIVLDISGTRAPLIAVVRALLRARRLTTEDGDALILFYQIRNRIVHGHDADDEEIARAIDSGTRLLRLLLSRPRPSAETTKGPDEGD
jgi:hypothetical protein